MSINWYLLVQLAVLFEGGVVLGLAAFVLWLYVVANRAIKNRLELRIPGAMPYHVAAMAAAHCSLVLATVSRNVAVGLSWWSTPLVLIGYTLSLFALLTMLRWQQTRAYLVLKEGTP
jgi:hypothetical protein